MDVPNFNTATREEYTKWLLEKPFESNTVDQWKRQAMDLQDVLRLLAYHPAMVDTGNLAQKYTTPANSKNKIYFMWDFVSRTLAMLYTVPPTVDSGKQFDDIVGRGVMAAQLLLDKMPGMLDQLVDSSYPGQSGDKPVIGEDLKAAARDLTHEG